MKDLSLHHPVFTLDQKLNLPAGLVLTQETMEEITSLNKKPSSASYSLLQFASVRGDLLDFLANDPYRVIFSDKEVVEDLFSHMKNVRLFGPVLESLEYFQKYDFHTYRHILMVFALSSLLARDLLPDYGDQIRLSTSGPIHDIGKVCVPLDILRKNSPLTRNEKSIVEHHTVAGYVMLSYYLNDNREFSVRVARDHHERNNGRGYPCGVRMDDRMMEIIAVCDVYDALISPRPYRSSSYDNRTALEEITRMAEEGEVCWDVVTALVARNRRNQPPFRESKVSVEKRGVPPEDNVHGIIADE